MSIYEYDEERELRLIRRDEREIGRQEERQIQQENAIQSIISLCREFGAGKEKTVEKLTERYHLSKEQAEEKIALYWGK